MRKLFAAVVPLGLALVASSADARTMVVSGSACQPEAGSTCIQYSQYGAHNVCTSTQNLECPITHSYNGSPNVTQVYFTGYDRHSTQNVTCTIRRQDAGGDILFSAARSTSGEGAADQIAVWLNLTQPQGFWWSMRCSLPPAEAGEWSHLTSYVWLTTE